MLSPMQIMLLFSFVYLSAAEVLSSWSGEATAFWRRELVLSENWHVALREKRVRGKERWEGGGRREGRSRAEEVNAAAVEEEEEEDGGRAAIGKREECERGYAQE